MQAKNLTEKEQAVKDVVVENQKEALTLLKDLVNINSGTMNFDGVKTVTDIADGELQALGFDTRWEKPAGVKRAAHLFASREGGDGKRVLLLAHADTVYPKDNEFQKFRQDKNNAYGPGVIDDKGGMVVLIQALKALEQTGQLEDANITVAIISDEESVGEPLETARQPLIDAAQASNYVLAFEPGYDFNEAVTGRRGIAYWRLDVESENAETTQSETVFNANFLVGGTDADDEAGTAFGKGNVIPQKTITTGTLQCETDADCQNIQDVMKDIVSQTGARSAPTKSTIKFITDETNSDNILNWQLNTEGQGGHSSRIFLPEFGHAAILETARILAVLAENIENQNDAILSSAYILSNFEQALIEDDSGLTFNPSVIAGGTEVAFDLDTSIAEVSKENIPAQQAVTYGDIRYLSKAQCEKAIQVMKKTVADANTHANSETKTSLEFVTICKPSMSPSDKNEALLETLSDINVALGYGEVTAADAITRGAADVSYIADLENIEGSLDSLGPTGSNMHAIEESMQIDSLTKATERAAILINRLIHPTE
ncbi:MAG: M20/M25/M40 family metallo-hydrolase [Gammaproteobacteria bacterium]